MNNTNKRRTSLTAIIFICMAATLVVGTAASLTTTTQSAFAYTKDNGKGNGNGNTVTIQKCEQLASESGWDNDQEQECENLICTHPGENATCVQEGAVVVTPTRTSTTTPVNKATCEQCFRNILTQAQINELIAFLQVVSFPTIRTLAQVCFVLDFSVSPGSALTENSFREVLSAHGVTDVATQDKLIECLLQAGLVFHP
jgi:hypothetical protein